MPRPHRRREGTRARAAKVHDASDEPRPRPWIDGLRLIGVVTKPGGVEAAVVELEGRREASSRTGNIDGPVGRERRRRFYPPPLRSIRPVEKCEHEPAVERASGGTKDGTSTRQRIGDGTKTCFELPRFAVPVLVFRDDLTPARVAPACPAKPSPPRTDSRDYVHRGDSALASPPRWTCTPARGARAWRSHEPNPIAGSSARGRAPETAVEGGCRHQGADHWTGPSRVRAELGGERGRRARSRREGR